MQGGYAVSTNKFDTLFPQQNDIPAEYLLTTPRQQRSYLHEGEICHWDGRLQDVYGAIWLQNGKSLSQAHIGSYPLMDAATAANALDSAVRAFDGGHGEWATMPVRERISHLEEFTFCIRDHRDEVVRLLMWEIGKALPDAQKEFDRTVEYINDTIDALKDLDRVSSRFVIEQGIIAQIRRAPLGVVLCMGPYNYPLNETFTTLIPALIMGNTVVFKPPKLGVLLHEPLLKAFRDAFPLGVVNTVYGDGETVIGPIMQSGRVDALAFIGSSTVADILKKQHPRPHRLRSVLGLEAKNAGIVLADADIEQAVEECVTGALSFNGQRCTALKVLFVHDSIIDSFTDLFSDAVDRLQPGVPWVSGVKLTPLPDPGMTSYLTELVDDAVQKGAHVVNPDGGLIIGTYFHPAVLRDVTADMRVYHEEQFGPVVPIVSFSAIDEAVEYISSSPYGQQVSIFGSDHTTIAGLVDELVNQVCRVNINSQCQRGPDTFPFTGRKDSAEGTLSVSDALRVFSIRTLAAAKGTDQNKEIIRRILRENQSSFLSTDFIL